MWTKARLSRCYHQFICCHVAMWQLTPETRTSGRGASWDTVFCLLCKWSSVIMMQWYWYLHQKLSEKNQETKTLAFSSKRITIFKRITFFLNHYYYLKLFPQISYMFQRKIYTLLPIKFWKHLKYVNNLFMTYIP